MGGTGGESVAFLETDLVVDQTTKHNPAALRAEITSNVVFRATHLGGRLKGIIAAARRHGRLVSHFNLVVTTLLKFKSDGMLSGSDSNKLQSEYPRNLIDFLRHMTYAQRAMMGGPFVYTTR